MGDLRLVSLNARYADLGAEACVGRSGEASITINDGRISSTHIKVSGGCVVDCSTNGTWLNGLRLVRGASHVLAEGDVITLCAPSEVLARRVFGDLNFLAWRAQSTAAVTSASAPVGYIPSGARPLKPAKRAPALKGVSTPAATVKVAFSEPSEPSPSHPSPSQPPPSTDEFEFALPTTPAPPADRGCLPSKRSSMASSVLKRSAPSAAVVRAAAKPRLEGGECASSAPAHCNEGLPKQRAGRSKHATLDWIFGHLRRDRT
ncbi:hypothetical protein T492DRAFT_967679 [Pavlovales sp. CCMP2436]|nr:hypothetical protein T492DRAFT_967679 [Pavlovales sp. CCMP2436]